MKTDDTIQKICQAIADKKGLNTIVLDVRGISSLTDFFIIAEGTVPRHVAAIAHNIVNVLDADHLSPSHTEGLSEGSWVVLDYFDIVIHLFTAELRNFYSIEEIWKAGSIVPVDVQYTLPSVTKLAGAGRQPCAS